MTVRGMNVEIETTTYFLLFSRFFSFFLTFSKCKKSSFPLISSLKEKKLKKPLFWRTFWSRKRNAVRVVPRHTDKFQSDRLSYCGRIFLTATVQKVAFIICTVYYGAVIPTEIKTPFAFNEQNRHTEGVTVFLCSGERTQVYTTAYAV